MADGAGGDLLHRGLAAREPRGVIFRGEIADQRGDAEPLPKQSQRLLKQRRLSRAWAGDQTHDKNSRVVESLAKRAGDTSFCFKTFWRTSIMRVAGSLIHLQPDDYQLFAVHDFAVGVPHSEQQNHCVE